MGRKNGYLEHLASVPMFSACSQKDLGLIARLAENLTIAAGKELVVQGEHGREFFVIAHGSALVKRGSKTVGRLGPGDFFGELAVLDPAPRNATVVAETDMEVIMLGDREFSGLIAETPLIARKILKAMARRLREADARPAN